MTQSTQVRRRSRANPELRQEPSVSAPLGFPPLALRDSALAALLALWVHGAFLLALPSHLQTNESADYEIFYRPVALSWMAGDGWVTPEGNPALRYPPGFPAILGLAFSLGDTLGIGEETAVRGQNAFWLALGAALFSLLARDLCRRRSAAWLATVLWITYPPLLWLSKQPSSEMPFFVFAFLCLGLGRRACLAARNSSLASAPGGRSSRAALSLAVSAGLCAGLATLIRPVALALVIPALLAVLVVKGLDRRKKIFILLLGIGSQMLVLVPWEVWMWHQSGGLLPVSSGGRLSLLDGLTISIKPGRVGRPDLGPGTVELMQEIQAHRHEIGGPWDAARFLGNQALDAPGPVVRLLAAKAMRSWYATDSLRYEGWILALQIPYLILATLGLALWHRQSRGDPRRQAEIILVLAVTFYFWGMTFLVLSILRYMLPAMALLMAPTAQFLDGQILARIDPSRRIEREGRP